LELFVIEHLPGRAWLDGVGFREQPGVDVHMAFMRSLHDRGLLVLGGPFLDAADGTHVGMAVVRAESHEAAAALASEDPSVAAGLLRIRVRPWLVPMGTALPLD
jgi:uncharacterized protein YciI